MGNRAVRAETALKPITKSEQYKQTLLFQIRALGLPTPETEIRFHETRKWRLDVGWPAVKVAVEIEGIVFPKKGGYTVGGRHGSVKGFAEDCVKYNELAVLGWRLLRVLPKHITSGEAVAWIEALFSRLTPPASS